MCVIDVCNRIHKCVYSRCTQTQEVSVYRGALEDLGDMAESEGFEPSIPYGIHTFQACAFDHSASSPWATILAQ